MLTHAIMTNPDMFLGILSYPMSGRAHSTKGSLMQLQPGDQRCKCLVFRAHLKTQLDASAINIMRPRSKKKRSQERGVGSRNGLCRSPVLVESLDQQNHLVPPENTGRISPIGKKYSAQGPFQRPTRPCIRIISCVGR